MTKYQLKYFTDATEEVLETVSMKNLRAVKYYLSKKDLVGNASIWDYSKSKVFYYKPRFILNG